MAKITLATLKSFVRKNEGQLFINVRSKFDGMTDGVESRDGGFGEAKADDWSKNHVEHTLGYLGVWLVGSSRDSISAYEDDQFTGFHVYNCCGDFNIVIRKAV